ncbi:MAG: tripartite tricarboxylate transporter permease [Alphaproteobacteria bacterium]
MLIENIGLAAEQVFQLHNLGLMLIGVFFGIIAGAIPGFTVTMAVVLSLPFTFGMPPVNGLSTMLGIYVGGLSGGLISGMLMGIPGTPASIATTFDGFPAVRQGKAGLALGLGVWSSFFGGLIGAVVLATLAPGIAVIGLEFEPWALFSLIIFALTITASLAGENMIKGLIAGSFGLLFAALGAEEINAIDRLHFGFEALSAGFAYLPVLIGLFAFSQLLGDIEDPKVARAPLMVQPKDGLSIKIEHWNAIRAIASDWVNLVRSSAIGVFVGVLPAAGSSISNILAYDQAKKASKTPEKFGTGHTEGIIAPEAANNATAGGALTTMMALGIPGSALCAIMLGALLIHNVVPSPLFITEQPVLAYGIFTAFFLAHFMMIAMQTGALKAFLYITRVPMYTMAAVILVYCAVGTFALNNSSFDMWTLFWFGLLGFLMKKFNFPLAPVVLGVVLGDLAELNLNRAWTISEDVSLFFTQPWSLFFVLLSVFSIAFPWYQKHRGKQTWTLGFMPAMVMIQSIPLFMMGSPVRMGIGSLMVALGLWMLWRTHQKGWALDPADGMLIKPKIEPA